MHTAFHDFRHALRRLRQARGFTTISVGILALGIGGNVLMFNVLKSTILAPLPYADADRLVFVWNHYNNIPHAGVSPPDFLDYRVRNHSFSRIAAFTRATFNVTGGGDALRIQALRVTPEFLSTLGVDPVLGRSFTADEGHPGHERVAILTYGFWQRRFAGRRDALGAQIQLNDVAYRIVGILPANFRFVLDAAILVPLAWTPAQLAEDARGDEYLVAVARLQPNINIHAAQADLNAVAASLARSYPKYYPASSGFATAIIPIREVLLGDTRLLLLVLSAAVALIFLIACANIAGLVLARANAQRRELAIRQALGAGRARLVRHVVVESLVLSCLGALAGVLLAFWGGDAMLRFLPADVLATFAAAGHLSLQGQVLGWTVATIVLATVLAGLLPGLRITGESARVPLNEALNVSGRGTVGRRDRMRDALVVTQVALAVVLLAGAGLALRSLARLMSVNPGFDPGQVVSLRISLPEMRYATPATIVGFYQRLLDGVQALPGMQSAATISNLPMSGAVANESFLTEGHPIRPGEEYPSCDPHAISSEYFRTMRIPLINGRYFTSLDGPEAPRVAIIDTELARMYWPGENPLGRRLAFEGTEQAPSWRTIVGIVGSVKHYGLDAPSRGHLYYPMAQGHQPSMFLVARSRLPDSTLLPEIRQAVAAIDRNLPIYDVQTMQERVDSSLAPHRTSAGMLGIFAALALLLAAIGLYGLVAYLVVQRTAEIGVRMALGAQPGDVLRLVASDALRPSLIGAALGLLAAVMLSRWIAGLLYAVSPVDPLTYALVIAVLLSVVVVASVEPARRAIRIQPLDALRTN